MSNLKEQSQEYYGKTLSSSADLKTNACCTASKPPPHVLRALDRIHGQVKARYYGCGLIFPQGIENAAILDLGSGSGQDAYLLAQFVGEAGSVTGVDATEEQLRVANQYLDWHRDKFGYATSNVRFVEGDIEHLDDLTQLEPNSFDVIVSNCVVNLCEDKTAVLRGVHRLLKQGGEMYFSDVYSDRRIPSALLKDPVLHGECLSGALYWGDFVSIAKKAGFSDPRLVNDRPLEINNKEIAAKLDGIRFFSATYRLFKLDGLESQCEDYGQAVRYRGTVVGSERVFVLDKHHEIEVGRMFPVCGNTYRMLAESRLAKHFEFFGDFSRHYGVFAGCGTCIPFDVSTTTSTTKSSSSCC